MERRGGHWFPGAYSAIGSWVPRVPRGLPAIPAGSAEDRGADFSD